MLYTGQINSTAGAIFRLDTQQHCIMPVLQLPDRRAAWMSRVQLEQGVTVVQHGGNEQTKIVCAVYVYILASMSTSAWKQHDHKAFKLWLSSPTVSHKVHAVFHIILPHIMLKPLANEMRYSTLVLLPPVGPPSLRVERHASQAVGRRFDYRFFGIDVRIAVGSSRYGFVPGTRGSGS